MTLGKGAQYLSTLLNLETVLAEVLELLMIGRDGWGIDNQTRLFLLEIHWNNIDDLLTCLKERKQNENQAFYEYSGKANGEWVCNILKLCLADDNEICI